MSESPHDRAWKLLTVSLAEGVDAADRRWLESHLAECLPCARRRARVQQALDAVSLSEVRVDPRLLDAVRQRIRARAAGRPPEPGAAPAIAASLAGFVLSVASLWGLWSTLPAGIGDLLPVAAGGYLATVGVALVWSLGAAVCLWLLPAALVGLALALFNPRPGGAALLMEVKP